MTGVAALQDRFSQDAYVSQESEQVGRPIRRLLRIGWEMGRSTSITESEASLSSDALAQRFQHLAKIWREECAHLSSIREMVLHSAYQQIVGMGPAPFHSFSQSLSGNLTTGSGPFELFLESILWHRMIVATS